ncbi:MAG: transposase [Acidimicrobiales bacterium]|jgi:transposase
MEAREIKALQIAATMPLRKGTHGWIVPSQTGKGTYKVAPLAYAPAFDRTQQEPGFGCTCPDYEERGKPCKHVMAVELTIRREVTTEEGTVTEEIKVTYTQDWAAYNKAQCEEKDRFLPMLADLCSSIPQPPQGKGRPRLPISDMAFAAVSKVYGGMSARRSDSDVREHAAKGLTEQDPHFNSVLRYLRDPEMTPILRSLVELSALPLKGVETDFAADSTGFTTCRFVRWFDHKWGSEAASAPAKKREWIKLHAMTGVRTNIVTAVEISGWRSHDTNYFRPLLATTAESFDMRDVTADKAYSSKVNIQAAEDAGATAYIPFRGPIPAMEGVMPKVKPETHPFYRMQYLFAYQRDSFLARYHQRSNVETTFSMIKAKFGDSLRSKSDTGQINEVLCKVICHNLVVLISCIHEIGLDVPTFGEQPAMAG